jgi:DNA-binding transcriptional ArsR family regulator
MVTSPGRVSFGWGTGYDLFISLTVLHSPTDFDIRPTWASGVRSRLPVGDRQTLEAASRFIIEPPYALLDRLPQPRDASAVLDYLGGLSPDAILPSVGLGPHIPSVAAKIYEDVAAESGWTDDQRRNLTQAFQDQEMAIPPTDIDVALASWAQSEAFGAAYLQALRMYYEIFFEEEERRLRPALQTSLDAAKEKAARLSPGELLEDLSRGLRLAQPPQAEEWVLIPSFWVAPVTMYAPVSADHSRWAFVYNARPPDASLVPGEFVPDALLQALQAISDPTRLRIMRLLQEEPLTPSQIARRLRLRLSTVTHHLKLLRHAAMVQVDLNDPRNARYATRMEGLRLVSASLQSYVTRALDPDQPLPIRSEPDREASHEPAPAVSPEA